MKLPTLLMLAIFCSLNFSQDTGIIRGKVSDKNDLKGIEADVKLFKEGDSILVKATKCDTSGAFTIENISYGTYRLVVSAVDYSTLEINSIVLKTASVSYDAIHLKRQSISTDEILVEDEKSMLQISGDKKIFNVNQTTLTKGGNALDVLRKTPLVDVDINDNVSLRGSTNVMILINDKPNKFVNLKTLPSNAIERIELITNPPAKYSAEGVTGIINIVLKKGHGIGFNGSIYGGLGSKDKYNTGLSLNLKKDKTSIFTNGYYGIYTYGFDYTSSTEYFSPRSWLEGSGNGTGKSKYGYGSLGIEYDIASKSTIGLETYLNKSNYNSGNHTLNRNLDSIRSQTYFYSGNSQYEGDWDNYSLNMYYTGKYDDLGRELAMDLTFSGNSNNNNSGNTITYFNSSGMQDGNPNIKSDRTNNKQRGINGQADYTHPFGDKLKLETGYKLTYRTNDNEFTSDTLNHLTGKFETNTSVANHFKLTESINAVYASVSSKLGSFGFKLGLRTELTHTKGELLSNNTSFAKDYIDLFPTLNVNYTIGMMNQVSASYSRRITRPNIWRMNPFVNKWSNRYIYYGNPKLKPEFTDSYELSFIYYSNIITLTPVAFYRRSKDIISSYSYLQDTIVTVTTYRNAAGSSAYGFDLIMNSRTLKWLNLNGTLSFYNTKFDSEAITDYNSEEGFSWRANIRSYITISGLFNVELYYNYTGRKVNSQGRNEPTSTLDVGLSTMLLNSKLSISLRASDVFKRQNWSQVTEAIGYTSTYTNKYDSRVVFLNISYSFGNTDEYYSKKKKTRQNMNEGNDSQQEDNVR